ncbi:hypothetical protein F4781DRAFT_427882 [Annulohypoxylon bovei var. microspora]|nr:hypothetical protein F4781DRAFT_427882 [Annulohypoxylon bovei var. microspora]
MSSNPESKPESMSSDKLTFEIDLGLSSGFIQGYDLSFMPSLQSLPQPQPQLQPQSEQAPVDDCPVAHLCPVTKTLTAGPLCSYCYYHLDDDSSPPPPPPPPSRSSSIHSSARNHVSYSCLEAEAERICREANDFERQLVRATEIIRQLTAERDALRRRVSELQRSITIAEDFGLNLDRIGGSDPEPSFDGVSWEDVDPETDLEAGSIISSWEADESDLEIDPEWFRR